MRLFAIKRLVQQWQEPDDVSTARPISGFAPRRTQMTDKHAMELKQALIAVLATAASMGIDIDELSEQAANDLAEEEMIGWSNQFKPGAMHEIRYCHDLVKGAALVDR